MKVHVKSRRRLVALAAAVAGLALVGGIAYAVIPDSSGVIHGCFKTASGALRVIDPSTTSCLPSETAISWNQVGPPGPPGAVSGYEEKTHQVFVSAGAVANVSVSCSTGKKVLGGGFDIETPDDVKVFSSEPSDGSGNVIDNGWNVFVHNTGSVTRQVTVTAICASV
jgi:hypothetical protein